MVTLLKWLEWEDICNDDDIQDAVTTLMAKISPKKLAVVLLNMEPE